MSGLKQGSHGEVIERVSCLVDLVEAPSDVSSLAELVWTLRALTTWHRDHPLDSQALCEWQATGPVGFLPVDLGLADLVDQLIDEGIADLAGMSPREYVDAVHSMLTHSHRRWRDSGYPPNWRVVLINAALRLAGVPEQARIAVYQELEAH